MRVVRAEAPAAARAALTETPLAHADHRRADGGILQPRSVERAAAATPLKADRTVFDLQSRRRGGPSSEAPPGETGWLPSRPQYPPVPYDPDVDDYGDEYDIRDDPSFNENAEEWAQARAEELKQEWAAQDLESTIESAHDTTWPKVEESLRKAARREAEAEYAEATFHLVRALEGYVRGTYLNPMAEQLLAPFRDNQGQALLEVYDLVPSSLIGRSPQKQLLFALLGVTGDVATAQAVVSAFNRAIGTGEWSTRNRIVHSLHIPAPEHVKAFDRLVRSTLEELAAPIRHNKNVRAEEVAERRSRHRSPLAWPDDTPEGRSAKNIDSQSTNGDHDAAGT